MAAVEIPGEITEGIQARQGAIKHNEMLARRAESIERQDETPPFQGEPIGGRHEPYAPSEHSEWENTLRLMRMSRANLEHQARAEMKASHPDIDARSLNNPELIAAYTIDMKARLGEDARGYYPEYYDPNSPAYKGPLFGTNRPNYEKETPAIASLPDISTVHFPDFSHPDVKGRSSRIAELRQKDDNIENLIAQHVAGQKQQTPGTTKAPTEGWQQYLETPGFDPRLQREANLYNPSPTSPGLTDMAAGNALKKGVTTDDEKEARQLGVSPAVLAQYPQWKIDGSKHQAAVAQVLGISTTDLSNKARVMADLGVVTVAAPLGQQMDPAALAAHEKKAKMQAQALRGNQGDFVDRMLGGSTNDLLNLGVGLDYDLTGKSSTQNITQLLDASRSMYASELPEQIGFERATRDLLKREEALEQEKRVNLANISNWKATQATNQAVAADQIATRAADDRRKIHAALDEFHLTMFGDGSKENPGQLNNIDTFKGDKIDPWGEFSETHSAVTASIAVVLNTALSILSEGRIPNFAMKWFSDAARRNIDAQWKTYQMQAGQALEKARVGNQYIQTLARWGLSKQQTYEFAMGDLHRRAQMWTNSYKAMEDDVNKQSALDMLSVEYGKKYIEHMGNFRNQIRDAAKSRIKLDVGLVDKKIAIEDNALQARFDEYEKRTGRSEKDLSQHERNQITDNDQLSASLLEIKALWLKSHEGLFGGKWMSLWNTSFKEAAEDDEWSITGTLTDIAKKIGWFEGTKMAHRIDELGKILGRRIARRFDTGNIAKGEAEFYQERSIWPGLEFDEGVSRIRWMTEVLRLSSDDLFLSLHDGARDQILSVIAKTYLNLEAAGQSSTNALNASRTVARNIQRLLNARNTSGAAEIFRTALTDKTFNSKRIHPTLAKIMGIYGGEIEGASTRQRLSMDPKDLERVRRSVWEQDLPTETSTTIPERNTPSISPVRR